MTQATIRNELEILASHASLLPLQARELVRLIGVNKTLALVASLGGTTFPMPHGRNKQGELRLAVLAEVVGDASADTLSRQYGGTRLYIPNCKDALRRVRNICMIEEYDARIKEGQTAHEVVFDFALRYRLADRVIWDIVNKSTVAEQLAAIVPRQQQHSLL